MQIALIFLLLMPVFAVQPEDLQTSGTATVERNKAAARRYFEEMLFRGKPELAAELVAPQYVSNDQRRGNGVNMPLESLQQTVREWCGAGGDCTKSEIVSMVADGDRVATYLIFRQEPKGTLRALMAAALGDVPLARPAINMMRFNEQGKIVEMSLMRDDLGILADQGYVNLVLVFVFALGGALGMSLMYLLARVRRRRA